jgi:hypothetical protein
VSTYRTRIDELARILEGHQADEEEALAAGRLRTFASTLDGHVQKLTALVEAAEESARTKSSVPTPERSDDLLRALESAEQEAREDVLAVGRGEQPAVVAVAAEVVQDLTMRVDTAWEQLREADPPPVVDPELLELATVDEPELGQRYAGAEARVYLLREKPRPGPGDIDAWSQAVTVLREVELAVAEKAPSQSVIEFLREAASNIGAPLTALDGPGVRDWLEQEDRADRYRIFAQRRRQS